MKWVTREKIRVNRAATAWLIRRFVDADAEFLFVPAADVARVQAETGATGFDADGATWPHRDAKGRTSFEAIVARHCHSDLALREMGKIVATADLPERFGETEEGAGLRMICLGFPLAASGDHDTLVRSAFLFEALYRSLAARQRANPE